MATSCFLRFQLSHYFFSLPSSSSSSCRSRSCTSHAQTESQFRGIRLPGAACSRQETSSQSFLPPLGLRPNALVPMKESQVKTAVRNQNNEIATDQVGRPSYTFQSSLSARFGLISLMLGLILGYAVNQKERTAAYAVIETMRRELKELEDQISLLQSTHGEQNALMSMESGIFKLSDKLSKVSKLLKSRLDDDEQLETRELRTAKEEDLQKSEAKLQSVSDELRDALKNKVIMQRKLGLAQKELDTAVKDLNAEKKLVASLKDHVQLLENQAVKERELRKSLELKLEEATELVRLMKVKANFLFNQLKGFNSRILSLAGEKEGLHKLLADERRTLTQTQKNLEDAQNQIMKLGQEREDLESKANKLGKELDSAKGAILSLKSQKVVGNVEE
ncbi:MAR-binding filament-like protein 1 [Neltuma alba]|uniref:MAR-binding filament-like protein 1 n=1 Tax=Neltuma alba TaxID=207710 RepID=UPI0010A3ED14|nr:MAR-binding filament-like protein 1 [Prosopis alba]